MKDLLIPASCTSLLAAVSYQEASGWWEVIQRGGIAAVSLILLAALAWWTNKREEKRDAKRSQDEKEDRDERIALAKENNRLNELILAQSEKHAQRMETLVKEQIKTSNDNATEMRNLTRKMKRPCVLPLTED